MKKDWFQPVSGNDENMSKRKRDKLKLPQPEPEVASLKEMERKAVTHNVTITQDHVMKFPQLFLEVYFATPGQEAMFATMFARSGCTLAKSLDTADLLVFTGGADVDPKLYEAEAHPKTGTPNVERDTAEAMMYYEALKLGVPMFGVCRGLQFLHVMQGGSLFQHVDGHNSSHPMKDLRTHEYFDRIPSTHHQMVKSATHFEMEVLATSLGVSKCRESSSIISSMGPDNDIEAVFYPDTCCLGVQGHPEYAGYSRYTYWVLKLIEDKIINNHKIVSVHDQETKHSNYRFKQRVTIPSE